MLDEGEEVRKVAEQGDDKKPTKVPDYLLNQMKDEPPYGAPPDDVSYCRAEDKPATLSMLLIHRHCLLLIEQRTCRTL